MPTKLENLELEDLIKLQQDHQEKRAALLAEHREKALEIQAAIDEKIALNRFANLTPAEISALQKIHVDRVDDKVSDNG